MSKKSKTRHTKPKESRKPTTQPTVDPSIVPSAPAVTESAPASEKKNRMLRAVVVTPTILEAARAYKRATGVSFYQLGREAIAEKLAKEGYLDAAPSPKA